MKFINKQSVMQGSKYYSNTRVLSGVFEKQDRLTRPIVIEETNVPFHFQQKSMTPEQQKKLMQKRIFEHPQLYISTHAKCQICNKFIDIDQVDQHSRIHFDEEERIEKILSNNNAVSEPQRLPEKPVGQP